MTKKDAYADNWIIHPTFDKTQNQKRMATQLECRYENAVIVPCVIPGTIVRKGKKRQAGPFHVRIVASIYSAQHIPPDLRDILRNYITIGRKFDTTSHLITAFLNTLTSCYHTYHQMALID